MLATNLSAAFSADAPDARLTEEALPHIGCILGRLHWPYSLRVVPWRRTYQDVKNNRIDGFFPVIPMQQLEPYAVLSAPLLLENWYWFWRADMPAPDSWRQGYKLGSIMGSQQETWLRDAGYQADEPKYSEVYGKPTETLHIGGISYDESSKRFSVHVSVPVNLAGETLGVLVVGVDVERALSSRD